MAILIFLLVQWYLSLFFQTFFLHRYAGHRHFTMSKFWEKVFYFGAWFFQGFTALSPNAYGQMHHMHHAYTDTEKDAHSPHHDKSIMAMFKRTHNLFRGIRHGTIKVEKRFTKNLPWWSLMEKYGYTAPVRLGWAVVYIAMYYYLVPEESTWLWCFLPLHFMMSPIQAIAINWFAHLIGYTNYKVSNESKNLLPIDLIMLGEAYHNNHHARPGKVSFSKRWYEIDPVYIIILLFNKLRIVRVNKLNIQPKKESYEQY